MRILLVLPNEASAFAMLITVFKEMGYLVDCFFYRTLASPTLNRLGRIYQHIRPCDFVMEMNHELVRVVEQVRPDLVFINKGETIHAETVRKLRYELGTKVASWYVDSPLWIHNSSQHILDSLRWFNVAFVFDGYYIPEMKRWGCQRAEVLSFACDPGIHKTIALSEKEKQFYGSDVCFIGSHHGSNSDRDRILGQLVDYDLKIWGDGWQHSSNPLIRRHWMGQALAISEVAKVYSASKIAVNITYPHSITQPNMRTFEAPACGILLLNDWLSGLDSFFDLGKEVECYSSVSDLRQKLDFYLANPDAAARIGQAGQLRAHREHTYVSRMEQMVSCVFEE